MIYHIGDEYNFYGLAHTLFRGKIPVGAFTNFSSYKAHKYRSNYLDSLNTMNPQNGGYPVYCKKFALSNGLLGGEAQPNADYSGYFGPSKDILDLNATLRAWELGNMRDIYNIDMLIKTTGTSTNDTLFHYTHQTYTYSRDIFWFFYQNCFVNTTIAGVNITICVTLPIPIPIITQTALPILTQTEYNLNAMPIDHQTGGMLTLDGLTSDFYDKSRWWYNLNLGKLHPTSRQLVQFNISSFISNSLNVNGWSEGLTVCHIPTASALDYGTLGVSLPLNHNILNDPIAHKFSQTPFDVITGQIAHPNHLDVNFYYDGSNFRDRLLPGVNGDHFDFYNFKLGHTLQNGLPSYFLNREIGEDTLYLDNSLINRPARFQNHNRLVAGVKTNPYYEYSGTSVSSKFEYYLSYPVIPSNSGVFARENPLAFVTTGNTPAKGHLKSATAVVNTGIVGPWVQSQHQPTSCPNQYVSPADSAIWPMYGAPNFGPSPTDSYFYCPPAQEEFPLLPLEVELFPNPSFGQLTLSLKNLLGGNYSVLIMDLQGRIMHHQKTIIRDFTAQKNLPLNLLCKSGSYWVLLLKEDQVLFVEPIQIVD